jgi:hypothetical protein
LKAPLNSENGAWRQLSPKIQSFTAITPLSIDWLAENLERRIGIENHAWTSGLSMSHGEHPADTASWFELSQSYGTAPAWLMRIWSTGAWAGPRLFLATLDAYTGMANLSREYQQFERKFWNT